MELNGIEQWLKIELDHEGRLILPSEKVEKQKPLWKESTTFRNLFCLQWKLASILSEFPANMQHNRENRH